MCAGEEMRFQGAAGIACLEDASHAALARADSRPTIANSCGGDRLVRQLPVHRPVDWRLEERDPRRPKVDTRAPDFHRQHRQLQLQL